MEPVDEILKNSYANKSLKDSGTSSNDMIGEEPPGIGDPDCPYCDGLGFVIPDVPQTHPSFGRAEPCTCRAMERTAEKMQKLQKLSQLGALSDRTFDTFLQDGHGLTKGRQRNLRMAYNLALAFAKEPEGWLILKGGYGCGKTHIAAAIANSRINLGFPVLFINTPDLLDHLRSTFRPGSPTGYDALFDQVRNSPLLVLDDLGAQSDTGWAQEKLYQIFNYRYNNRLPTVVTTNEELEAIDIRVRSRMVDPDLGQIVHIAAPDFRLAGPNYDQFDISSLNLHIEQHFNNFSFRDQELQKSQAASLKRAYDAAYEFAQEPEDWLVFYSIAYGNGKTHLAAAIANQVSDRGEPVLFITVPDLLDHLRDSFNASSRARLDKRFKEIKMAGLLILDDLGSESPTGWAKEKLYQLFDYRYNARLPTIITTATHLNELDEKLVSRIMDTSRSRVLQLEVPSYLGGGKSQNRYNRR